MTTMITVLTDKNRGRAVRNRWRGRAAARGGRIGVSKGFGPGDEVTSIPFATVRIGRGALSVIRSGRKCLMMALFTLEKDFKVYFT